MPTTAPPDPTANGHSTSTPTRRRTNPVGQKPAQPAAPAEPSDAAPPTEPAADVAAADHHSPTSQPTPGRVSVDAEWFTWVQHQLQQPIECQATQLEIGIPTHDDPDDPDDPGGGGDPGDHGGDPFDADLLLTGPDPTGREVTVWLRLTPTVITDLQARLDAVLTAQRHALGVDPTDPDPTNPDAGSDDAPRGPARARRIADPLGVRSVLQTSTTKAHVIIAAAVIALVLLAVISRLAS